MELFKWFKDSQEIARGLDYLMYHHLMNHLNIAEGKTRITNKLLNIFW